MKTYYLILCKLDEQKRLFEIHGIQEKLQFINGEIIGEKIKQTNKRFIMKKRRIQLSGKKSNTNTNMYSA
jgi:hypothetical protein